MNAKSNRLPPIKVEGRLSWVEQDGYYLTTKEGLSYPLRYTGEEINLAGGGGKLFTLHGGYLKGLLIAERMEAYEPD